MKEKFQYQFDPANGIMYKLYFGSISIEDIISSWEYAFVNNLITKETKGFILDYRHATFNMQVERYTDIADFYKKNIHVFRNHKFGILTNNPQNVVIPMLVETKDDGYFSKPFSTLEAALQWVLS